LTQKGARNILSFDETDATLDTTERKKQKTVTVPGDDGATIATKNSNKISAVGGSFASGDSLPPLLVFAGSVPASVASTDAPRSSIINPATGEGFSAQFYANQSGGMTNDLITMYFNNAVKPCLVADEPFVILCDGHISHVSYDFLQAVSDAGGHVYPPHTA
jgi:hypothetical protein